MKKRILLLSLAAALLLAALPAAALPLTPAVLCMADDVTLIKTGVYGSEIRFGQADFRQALGVSRFDAVTVVSLPDPKDGVLAYGGIPVVAGQSIPYGSVSSLTFTPLSARTDEARFTFRAGNLAGGAEVECQLRFTNRENYAPTVLTAAESALAMQTRRGISLYGTMAAEDPEGDALSFRVVSYPKHGELRLSDRATGEFCYTPNEGYAGEDAFRYVVRDEYGNWSGVAEVTIRVANTENGPVLFDLQGKRSELAALEMVSRGVMQTTTSGDTVFFHPEEGISRGDFVVMAMKAAGISPVPGLTETCFDDNEEIPVPLRPYLAAAQRYGIITGEFRDGRLQYGADLPITRAEAAVILCRIVDPEEPLAAPTFADNAAIPAWARSAIGALYDIGVYEASGSNANAKSALTREDAAGMLWRMILLSE